MKIIETRLPGVLIIESRTFRDDRGYFLETWHQARFAEAGLPAKFVQDNLSYSLPGVLRGLHYQHPSPQGKLVRVLQGEAYDVAVDIRLGSPTFGRWVGVTLAGPGDMQLYVPEGFAHGFVVIGDHPALFSYKCTGFYDPPCEGSILWNDPDLGIDWPVREPILAAKDRAAPRLGAIDPGRLPRYDPGP
jgi:dTDP-4-dehydrorhamnose 3,5-epimerase